MYEGQENDVDKCNYYVSFLIFHVFYNVLNFIKFKILIKFRHIYWKYKIQYTKIQMKFININFYDCYNYILYYTQHLL